MNEWFFNSSVSYRGIPLFAYLLPYFEEKQILITWNYTDPLQNASQGAQSNTAVVLPLLICPSDQIAQNPITDTTHGRVTRSPATAATAAHDPRSPRHQPPMAYLHHRSGLRADAQSASRPPERR